MFIIIAFMACIVGALISAYIYTKKRRHQKLFCPREQPCDIVLHSKFGKTLGVSNESLGLLYFFFISMLLFLIVSSNFYTLGLLYVLFFTLIIGGLFSLYLIGLQAFVIKSWCAWCLGIALSNFILIVSIFNLPFYSITPILASQKIWWVIAHNIGFILGLGSATITDIFFFRFLKDSGISQEEKETMDTLTNIIWVGLAILIITGVALFLPEQARLAISSKFLLKVVVVSVIVVNGLLLNMFVGPHMRRLSFEGTVPARRFRRLAFALGGVSLTSWYLAFFLGSLRKIHIDFKTALIGYATLLVLVIISSQIAERYVTHKHTKVDKEPDQG
jgi:uncharacterized membrane protein